MIPIQELLSRIRWDPEFGQGEFVIGYYDRMRKTLTRAPLRELHFEPGDHYSFRFVDAAGEAHDVPLHRIREVYRNGELIWHRDR